MREHLLKDEVVFRGGVNVNSPWSDENVGGKSLGNASTMGIQRMRAWLLGILGFLLLSLMYINSFMTNQFTVSHFANITIQDNFVDSDVRVLVVPKKISGYLVHTKGCRIAAFDPLDLVAKKFIEKKKRIVCEFGTQLPLVESNETAVFINPDAHNQYYNSSEIANCTWRGFERKKNNDNFVKYHNESHAFESSSTVTTEFVKVECFKNDKRIYRDYHFFVPRKPLVEERCRIAQKLHRQSKEKTKNHLSILVLGLDSVSRQNFHRMMPKTVKSLMSLDAVEMMGYTKVGDNTYPNLVPVLTGLSDTELQSHCWNNTHTPFDDCPFLWKNFSEAGYRTVLAEDACGMTTFNYLKPGFRVQPTDYYFRPYCMATESDIGNTHELNADLCVGTRMTYENLLNYTRKIAKEFASDPYFAFFWEASLTHDFFNYPALGDDAYANFLEYLQENQLLKNTALIVMSDHGMRWGDFRQTYQGRIEGSLPSVFMVFPDWWKRQFPTAWVTLKKNSASLTTPFDLHETLVDLLRLENINEEFIQNRSKNIDEESARGISWFLPLADSRTCSTAGIPGHWCMCHQSSNISLDDSAVQNSTRFIINELNKMVKKYKQCSTLTLKKVIDAKVWSGHEEVKQQITPWTDYTIAIETVPGEAIFEASVRHSGDTLSLVGSISRLNAYGNQSACIDDSTMRLYCYCHN